ncbi:hypothetical protein DNTS_001945, partial [Danionella cerebrum]
MYVCVRLCVHVCMSGPTSAPQAKANVPALRLAAVIQGAGMSGKLWRGTWQRRQSMARFTLKSADSSGRESSHFHLVRDLLLTFTSHFSSQELLSLLNCVASHSGIQGTACFVTYHETFDSLHF